MDASEARSVLAHAGGDPTKYTDDQLMEMVKAAALLGELAVTYLCSEGRKPAA